MITAEKDARQLSYWCSWSAQNSVAGSNALKNAQKPNFIGDQGALEARSMMNEEILFGENGFASLYPEVRGDLYFMADDGWDVPYGASHQKFADRFGSVAVDTTRFPSFTGTPAERLKAFNEKIKACGWKGLGIWIAAQCAGEGYQTPFTTDNEDYWKERILWCKYAGVTYWKVDWGTDAHNPVFRRFLTETAATLYPELVIEHAACMGPFNGELPSVIAGSHHRFTDDQHICALSQTIASFSEVFRTYDVTTALSTATTLDRVAHMLPLAGGYLNAEDELYLGAALGCQLGIMRNPYNYKLKPSEMHLAEVTAAIRWQRIAPPFTGTKTLVSDEILFDSYAYGENENWFGPINGHTAIQGAPSVIARNTALPVVVTEGQKPFVTASSNPSGAYTVCVLPRVVERKAVYVGGEIVCPLVGKPTDIAIFGQADRFTFRLENVQIRRIRAESLYSGNGCDITEMTQVTDTGCTLDGQMLRSLWDADDSSAPALHLRIAYVE